MSGADGKVLFGRQYQVVVAPVGSSLGLDVSELRCTFKVKRTLKPDPNTATVEIYNLSESSRSTLEGAKKLVLRLDAGYVDTGTTQLFLGEVRNAFTRAEETDVITTVTSGDSEKEMQEARLHMTLGPGITAPTALAAIAATLNVGPGNLAQAQALLAAKGATAMYGVHGSAITGNAARAMTDICRSAGLEWSIQDGTLQFLNKNQPAAQKAVELSSDSGLIGSPSVDYSASSKTKKGGVTVKATCLIIPDLLPGRLAVMKTRFITGGFRIEEVEYEGDTFGDAWFAHLTLRAL